jgi:hypothetical protein
VADFLETKEFQRVFDAISQDAANERQAVSQSVEIIRFVWELRIFRRYQLLIHPTTFFALLPDPGEITHVISLFDELHQALPSNLHLTFENFRVRAMKQILKSKSKVKFPGGYDPANVGKRGSAKDRQSAWRGLMVRELRNRIPVDTACGNATIAGLLRMAGDKSVDHWHVRSILSRKKVMV